MLVNVIVAANGIPLNVECPHAFVFDYHLGRKFGSAFASEGVEIVRSAPHIDMLFPGACLKNEFRWKRVFYPGAQGLLRPDHDWPILRLPFWLRKIEIIGKERVERGPIGIAIGLSRGRLPSVGPYHLDVRLIPFFNFALAVSERHVSSQLAPGGASRNPVGIDSQVKRENNSNRAGYADKGAPKGPRCRVSSGSCGIPLGAKIGIVVGLSALAWLLIFAGISRGSDLVLRRGNGLKRALYIGGGFGVFGLIAIVWGYGG